MSQPVHPEEENPFKASRDDSAPIPEQDLLFSSHEETPLALRKTYAAHEASVKVIGLYFYLSAGAAILFTANALISPRFTKQVADRAGGVVTPESIKSLIIIGGIFSALFNTLLGFWLQALHNWVRWTIIVLTVLGILGRFQAIFLLKGQPGAESAIALSFIIISIYILYVLLSSNGKVVFSARYRSVVAETPQVRPRPSAPDLIFLGTTAALLIASFIYQLL